MKIEDIIALAGAGFSKQDIIKIAGTVSTPAPAPAPIQTPTPASAPASAPVPAPVQQTAQVTTPVTEQYTGQVLNNTPDTFVQGVQAMNGRLDTIAGLLQRNNILNSQMPPQPTTDDMLAAIINPPVVGGEK